MSNTSTVLAAVIPEELAAQARDLSARIRAHEDPKALRKEGAEMIHRLTKVGLDAFFLEPVRKIGLGSVTQGMVSAGLSTSAKAIGVVIRRIIGSLSAEQIVAVADLVDETLVDLTWEDGD